MDESLRKFDTSSVRQGRRKWRVASAEKGGKGSRGRKCARKSPAATWKEEEEMMIARRRCGAGERGEKQPEDPRGCRMCGKQRTYKQRFLEVWQVKDLRANFRICGN